jgi:hypothetical protein
LHPLQVLAGFDTDTAVVADTVVVAEVVVVADTVVVAVIVVAVDTVVVVVVVAVVDPAVETEAGWGGTAKD